MFVAGSDAGLKRLCKIDDKQRTDHGNLLCDGLCFCGSNDQMRCPSGEAAFCASEQAWFASYSGSYCHYLLHLHCNSFCGRLRSCRGSDNDSAAPSCRRQPCGYRCCHTRRNIWINAFAGAFTQCLCGENGELGCHADDRCSHELHLSVRSNLDDRCHDHVSFAR